MNQTPGIESGTDTKSTILIIDDEANILAALKRLFRPLGYTVLTAGSGAEALALLEKEAVDIVISDMRMPEMDGVNVLEQVRRKWPDVVRILLTGYSDLNSTIAAVNRGEVYRYISKPWNDSEMVAIVRDALERKHLLAEKQRLEALTLHQNEQLKALNASLEDKVRQRTEELRDALEHLKRDYLATIQVFANLMELRKGTMAGHSRLVARLCHNIAQQMGLPDEEIQDLEIAAQLHNIGKIGLPDHLLERPYSELTYEERTQFDTHPLRASAILMGLAPLAGAAQLIHSHREHYDGIGNALGLKGSAIPLGSRILLVASDYEALQQGLIGHDKLTPSQALNMIVNGRGLHYDPAVVDVLIKLMANVNGSARVETEFQLSSDQLRVGMLLTRDVLTKNGMLLLLKGTVLNAAHIREIKALEMSNDDAMDFFTHSI